MRARRLWALAAVGWAAAAAIYATHLYLYHFLQEQPVSFGEELGEALAHCAAWALLTPLALGMARRHELLDARWPRRLVIHLPVALLVALAQLLLHTLLDWGLVHRGGADGAELAHLFRSFLVRTYYANVVVYFALVLAAQALAHAQRRRAREAELERHLTQAQLDALRQQLQPHFLFNALNAVSALIEDEPRAAQAMLARLAELLRLSLDARNAGLVPLAREIELARAYLAIEQVRFQDRLRVTVDVEEAAAGALVPGLLLQPLVENAVRHGIARRPGPGSIDLVARRDGDRLSLRVRDDGVGLGDHDAAPREGIGLANVRARLQRLYGGAERLELFPRPEGGVEARVEIPLREEPVP